MTAIAPAIFLISPLIEQYFHSTEELEPTP